MARSLRTKRAIVWTVILLLFLAFEVYVRYPWLSLVIPGTILMWYGLLVSGNGDAQHANGSRAIQKRGPQGLKPQFSGTPFRRG
jgi:hypothetical protein